MKRKFSPSLRHVRSLTTSKMVGRHDNVLPHAIFLLRQLGRNFSTLLENSSGRAVMRKRSIGEREARTGSENFEKDLRGKKFRELCWKSIERR